MTHHWPQRQSQSTLLFFWVAAAIFVSGAALACLLVRVAPPTNDAVDVTFPIAFAVSTLLLLGGSFALHRAIHFIRIERQARFRHALAVAMFAGTLFVGVQSYGLWCLRQSPIGLDAMTGAGAFAFVITVLHAMHFCVALMFVVYVAVRAFAGRYDHEYYWGVTVCAWFWHALGAVWLVILGVFAISV